MLESFSSEIGEFKPVDATTNPSLVYAAVSKADYSHLVNEAVRHAQTHLNSASIDEKTAFALDHLVSLFKLLNVRPKYVIVPVFRSVVNFRRSPPSTLEVVHYSLDPFNDLKKKISNQTFLSSSWSELRSSQ